MGERVVSVVVEDGRPAHQPAGLELPQLSHLGCSFLGGGGHGSAMASAGAPLDHLAHVVDVDHVAAQLEGDRLAASAALDGADLGGRLVVAAEGPLQRRDPLELGVV